MSKQGFQNRFCLVKTEILYCSGYFLSLFTDLTMFLTITLPPSANDGCSQTVIVNCFITALPLKATLLREYY